MEPVALKRPVVAMIAGVLVIAVILWLGSTAGGTPALGGGARVVAPAGTRIIVEVINTTSKRGLARRATFALRDAGFDVVRFASDTARRDSTLVLDRAGHPDWALLVARALGGARVESRPDSSRYLHVTVLLGANWRPPAQPFHP